MHSENIVPSPIHMLRQLKRERSVATLVLAELASIDAIPSRPYRPFEIHKNSLTFYDPLLLLVIASIATQH